MGVVQGWRISKYDLSLIIFLQIAALCKITSVFFDILEGCSFEEDYACPPNSIPLTRLPKVNIFTAVLLDQAGHSCKMYRGFSTQW
jgi:hypothetical protein